MITSLWVPMAWVHDPVREAKEFRAQIGSDRRCVIFLFGAGTSQAVGLDGVAGLTDSVAAALPDELRFHYDRFLGDAGGRGSVEDVLNAVRLCRELLTFSPNHEAGGLKSTDAVELERAICRAIYSRVAVEPPRGIDTHRDFGTWVRSILRDDPVEIFTTNYDLLIESGLESAETPHFDGFVGTRFPHFLAPAVEAEPRDDLLGSCPPRSWVRVWKLHGSIGWRTHVDPRTGAKRVVRVPLLEPTASDDLLIFPSRQKYVESRKTPFIAYHDRLRKVLGSGEALLVVSGYSFGDEHINEIVFGALRSNPRLAVTIFSFEKLDDTRFADKVGVPVAGATNLTVYSPDAAIVGGLFGPWSEPAQQPPSWMPNWPFWDPANKRFSLGDFNALVAFFTTFVGARSPFSDDGYRDAPTERKVVAE